MMGNNEPLLSIVLPVYNSEKYVGKAIESILNQTFKDFELIIVNDASKDNSINICKKYSYIDERIKIVDKKINEGLLLARASGINIAKGIYVGFVDSDDFIDKNYYKLLIEGAIETDADIIISGASSIVKNKKYIETNSQYIDKFKAIKMMDEGIYFSFVQWDKIYKKDIIKRIIMKKYRGAEDVFANIQAFFLANKIYYCPSMGYNYIIRSDSLSHRKVSSEYLDFEYVYELLEKYRDTKIYFIIEYVFCRELLILFVRMIKGKNSVEEIQVVKSILNKKLNTFINNKYMSLGKKIRLLCSAKIPMVIFKLLIDLSK